ncbi:hypothetical protein [Fredinandcohnia onubensis]|nr:hypothetical protein [Fredinandcohnia onubensis]
MIHSLNALTVTKLLSPIIVVSMIGMMMTTMMMMRINLDIWTI